MRRARRLGTDLVARILDVHAARPEIGEGLLEVGERVEVEREMAERLRRRRPAVEGDRHGVAFDRDALVVLEGLAHAESLDPPAGARLRISYRKAEVPDGTDLPTHALFMPDRYRMPRPQSADGYMERMSHASTRLLATILATALTAGPLAASALTSPAGYRAYRIEFTDGGIHPRSAGAVVGRLELQTGARGIINGFYYPNEGARDVSIQGSRDGSRVNLRTDAGNDVDLNGTVDHGKIVGSGFIGGREVDFVASPQDGPAASAPQAQRP